MAESRTELTKEEIINIKNNPNHPITKIIAEVYSKPIKAPEGFMFKKTY